MDILQQAPVIGSMGLLITTLILGLTTVLLLVWYSTRNFDYWEKRGVPFVKPYPFFGSIIDNISKAIHEVEFNRYKKYGRIYGHFEGNRALLSVGDANILRNILIKDFQTFTGRRDMKTGNNIVDKMVQILQGEDWKRVRTIITPTFTTGKIKRMTGIFKDCAKTLVKNFNEAAKTEKPVEVKSLYSAFTMDVIASSAFSTKIDSHNDPNNEFVTAAISLSGRNVNWRFIIFYLFPALTRLFDMSAIESEGLDFFKNVTLQIIEERKKTRTTRNDFLQLLMDTAKEVFDEGKLDSKEADNDITENYGKDESDVAFKNVAAKKSLSRDELVAQCVIFFLAGFETTSSALSFASHLLALNPDVQEKLIEEIDDALRDNGGKITYEALQSMKYLDNVISETLRIFPPSVRLERRAEENYKLGDTGITIPKDMIITIPVFSIHRDPKYFPEPLKFDPNRFTSEERAKRSPYCYIPFGAGPRNCIGMRFALMEIKVCLAYVLSNFKFKKCAETKEPLDFYKSQILLQPKSVMLQLEPRTSEMKVL